MWPAGVVAAVAYWYPITINRRVRYHVHKFGGSQAQARRALKRRSRIAN